MKRFIRMVHWMFCRRRPGRGASVARCLALTFLLPAILAAPAQSFESATVSAQSDLERALRELSELHAVIAAEKIPLAEQLNKLEDDVIARRRQFDQAQRLRDSQTIDLNALQAEVKARFDENSYIGGLLTEYLRGFETRIHVGEVQRYRAVIDTAKLSLDDVNLAPAEKYRELINAVEASLQRVEGLIGGDIFKGRALAPSGVMENGQFALIGPVALFAGDDGTVAGLTELQSGSAEPTVFAVSAAHADGIRTLIAQRAGSLPLDPTLGNALKIEATKETFFQHVRKGGMVMVPILLLALMATMVAIVKWVQMARIRVARAGDLQAILDLLSDGRKSEALAQAAAIKGPHGELLTIAINHAGEKQELLEELLYQKLLSTRPRLERLMPFIALTAATAPLLGLLGTVTGMINTFKMITVFGTGNPKLLSSGISEALITTEFGLMVAIPALLMHALLSRRAKGVLAGMEQTAVGFVNGRALSEEGRFETETV